MSRKSNARFVKPMLETLEARDQPSFILSGAVQQQLQPPVTGYLNDMKDAASDLAKQVATITTDNKTATPGLTAAQAQGAFGKAVGDYQRLWNDQAAITTTVAADNNFINAVAMAELSEGDPIDLILVRFGGFFNINPMSGLNDSLNQANQIWNGGKLTGNLTTDINEDFSTLIKNGTNTTPPTLAGVINTTQTILGSAQTPTFAKTTP